MEVNSQAQQDVRSHPYQQDEDDPLYAALGSLDSAAACSQRCDAFEGYICADTGWPCAERSKFNYGDAASFKSAAVVVLMDPFSFLEEE